VTGREANGISPEKFTVTKPWRRSRTAQGCSARKKKKKKSADYEGHLYVTFLIPSS
jgi:hypothetical protein